MEITEAGGEAVVVAGDVSKEDINKSMVETAVEKFGQLDIAFLNAGSLARVKIVDATEEQIDDIFGANVKSVALGLKHARPAMAKSANKKGSVIVNTSCMGSVARGDSAGSGFYSASKAASYMLVKYAAIEAAEDVTRVNGIAPGVVATNIVPGLDEADFDGFGKAKQLVGRAGRPNEVANFVTFLSSDEASFMTGSVHLIDGGWTLKA